MQVSRLEAICWTMPEPFKNLAWDDFRLVKAVADARGLQGAANTLNINHSTVFRRLGQIEDALGSKLFERHRTGYVLTSAGEEMVGLAQRLDDDITAFTRKVAGREVAPAGELRVTTNDSLLVNLLTPLFAQFCTAYPDVRLDVILTNQVLNLSKRDADIAIRATDRPPDTLIGRRVSRLPWALFGRAQDFPDPRTLESDEFFQRRWVSMSDEFSLKMVNFVRANVAPENIVYKLNTVLGLSEAIEAGIGIGYLPLFVAGRMPSLVRLAPAVPEFGTDLWLLTHPDLRHAARVRAFMDFLATEIGKLRRSIEDETRVSPSEG